MSTFFENKVIWITGASSGIGAALVRALARSGALLVLSSRREEELRRIAEENQLEEFLILPFDVTDHEKVSEHAEAVLKRFGRIDLLINNAGISSRGLVLETGLDVYKKMMDVDFFSTVALTKAVLPSMVERRNGSIVVVSSLMGKFSTPWRSAYCAAKHALHGFYDALRAEVFQHNIKVTVICPGFVSTNIAFNALNNKGERREIQDKTNLSGMNADVFAARFLRAVAAGRDEAYIGGWELRGLWAKRFLPSLLNKKMRSFRPH